jgi:hypothetical protein
MIFKTNVCGPLFVGKDARRVGFYGGLKKEKESPPPVRLAAPQWNFDTRQYDTSPRALTGRPLFPRHGWRAPCLNCMHIVKSHRI